jgi:hypothetical protein
MDGLWTAEFGSSSGIFGGGVAIFRDGRILGGDGGYYYVGNYEIKDKAITATLTLTPFLRDYPSVFTTVNETLILRLSGTLLDEEHAIIQGHPEGKPDLRFGAKLAKRF